MKIIEQAVDGLPEGSFTRRVSSTGHSTCLVK
ncbi:MAG TPA: hypothetical protein VG165_14390 [Solirubrobacteraceae bacterium]|nr:hypothetical protein [Solirubrobacteraceae bacterium]